MRIVWLIFFSVIGVVFSRQLTSNFYHEESCRGGYCVLESECTHHVNNHDKNLCPGQKDRGAVCCKDFPPEKVNCYQTHNACFPKSQCPDSLNLGRKGCTGHKTCCVLV
ncbi:unnamed protein product [Phyllotreta striolata]|uniref:Carboxypeptidase inhibitor n=1 Tax=Phyllotreta striolata TaxID=444603 RepID=A0A9N9XL40_PHYSR|nr:unnamed protein product [Phyllotreta striolata]